MKEIDIKEIIDLVHDLIRRDELVVLDDRLAMLDPRELDTHEIIAWCRSTYALRMKLPSWEALVYACNQALIERHGINDYLKGLMED